MLNIKVPKQNNYIGRDLTINIFLQQLFYLQNNLSKFTTQENKFKRLICSQKNSFKQFSDKNKSDYYFFLNGRYFFGIFMFMPVDITIPHSLP